MTKKKVTQEQRQYVRGVIHNLALQRWQDKEIAEFLNNEKGIKLTRSSVTYIRNRMERQAEKWYFELRESRYKYVAMFKERIDSLFSYQKKLHDIISSASPDVEQKPEVKIKAITELHAIEVTLFTMWKQLPNLYVNNSIAANHVTVPVNAAALLEEERGYESTQIPPVDEIDERNRFDRWSIDNKPMSRKYIAKMHSKYGYGIPIESVESEAWAGSQCSECKRWFKNENIKTSHTCISLAATTGRENRWLNSSNGTERGGKIDYGRR